MNRDIPLPISFDDADEAKEDTYRGSTAVASRALEQNALQLQGDQMQGKNAIQNASKEFGGKSQDIVTLVQDEAGFKSKMQKGGLQNEYVLQVNQSAPETILFNEISSYKVEKMNESEIINKLNTILNNYNNDIDFEIDMNKNQIKNGVVFINNYYSVFFTFWTAKDNNNTRFEFRRQSGDALASAKFLGDIKNKFFGDNAKEEESLINLELNMDDMKELKVDDNNKEMMMIHEALINDEFVGDSLEENTENYLYQKLIEAKAISKENTIDHKILCKTLINKSLLLHSDVSVVRASLIILNKFSGIYNQLLLSNQLKELIISIFKQNKCKIVKKYAMNLLDTISKINEISSFELNDKLKEDLKNQIKLYQQSVKDDKNYNEKMFNNVYNKL